MRAETAAGAAHVPPGVASGAGAAQVPPPRQQAATLARHPWRSWQGCSVRPPLLRAGLAPAAPGGGADAPCSQPASQASACAPARCTSPHHHWPAGRQSTRAPGRPAPPTHLTGPAPAWLHLFPSSTPPRRPACQLPSPSRAPTTHLLAPRARLLVHQPDPAPHAVGILEPVLLQPRGVPHVRPQHARRLRLADAQQVRHLAHLLPRLVLQLVVV